MHADDTQITVSDADSLIAIQEACSDYKRASGSKVNWEKSKDKGDLNLTDIKMKKAAFRLKWFFRSADYNTFPSLFILFAHLLDKYGDLNLGQDVCLAGMSRSVTVVVAYIMSVTSLDHKTALKAVRGARNVANLNFGFQKQLQDFEARKLSEERKRLRNKFTLESLERDEEECKKHVLLYNNAMAPQNPSTSTGVS
ncbi:uncharacterized protein LOC143236448 [Tachypleus tridentatus]|uniref:uncharacterized protein LOC143236448 n=1 Tax=Tachypleus tridentatus TaxID=6853 RepID=UPI003FD5B344